MVGNRYLKTLKKFAAAILLSTAVSFVGLFWLAFFSARPELTIDPQTLAGDGSTINYCELPELDGNGKLAADIAKGNTPGCGYSHFPLPVLRECAEPIPHDADDIRGLWIGTSGGHVGHLERVEQCGERVVVTSAGLIHDSGPNSTAGWNTDDTQGSVLFTLRGTEYCPRTSAGMFWNHGILDFRAFGWGPVVVRRYMDGKQLIWEYADGSTTRMDRLCTLPEAHLKPQQRGPRIALLE